MARIDEIQETLQRIRAAEHRDIRRERDRKAFDESRPIITSETKVTIIPTPPSRFAPTVEVRIFRDAPWGTED